MLSPRSICWVAVCSATPSQAAVAPVSEGDMACCFVLLDLGLSRLLRSTSSPYSRWPRLVMLINVTIKLDSVSSAFFSASFSCHGNSTR